MKKVMFALQDANNNIDENKDKEKLLAELKEGYLLSIEKDRELLKDWDTIQMPFQMPSDFTILIKKCELAYVAVCLEINVSAQGETIPETLENLKNAIESYLSVAKEWIEIDKMPAKDLIEFLEE